MSDTVSPSDAAVRAKLGIRVVFWSSIGVVLLAIVVILAAAFTGSLKETTQLVFTSVLPLLGTWVGTVLAFYFTKESLESASRTTLNVVRSINQKLASIPVLQAMMKAGDVVKATVASGTVGDLPLATIDSLFKTALPNGRNISRLPIVNGAGACIGIVHRSVWMEMQVGGVKLSPAVDVTKDTLAKLLPQKSLAGKTFDDIVKGTIAFVASGQTLEDAKRAMEALSLCQDVFVTQSAKADEPMLGWISNVDITRLSQA